MRGALAREAAARRQGAAGGEQAVAQGLGIHVGELRFAQRVAHEDVAKSLELGVQLAACAFGFEGFVDQVTDQPSHASHAGGQLVWRGLDWHVGLNELGQQLRHFAGDGFVPADFAVFVGAGQAGGELALAVNEPAELDVVREDEVGQGLAIALELVAAGGFVERDADIFGLHIAQGKQATGDDVVRRAAGDALGLVGGQYVGRAGLCAYGFKQAFECGAVGVLGGVAGLDVGGNGIEVGFEWGLRHGRM